MDKVELKRLALHDPEHEKCELAQVTADLMLCAFFDGFRRAIWNFMNPEPRSCKNP